MTKLLEKAIGEIKKLPDVDQDKFASLILEELASEKKWDDAFAHSQDQLSQLADEAVEERRKGKTTPLKFN